MGKFYNLLIRYLLIASIGLVPIVTLCQGADTTKAGKTHKTRAEKRKDFNKYFFVNANIGVNLNHTDVAEHKFAPPISDWRLGYGGYFGWQFHPIWGVRAQITNGALYGSRTNDYFVFQPYTGVYYKASILDYHLDLTINFSNLFAGYRDRTVNVYGIAGFGQSQWKTQAFNKENGELIRWNGYSEGDNNNVIEEGTHRGFSHRTLVYNIPVGLGVSFRVSPKFDITFESLLKFVDSDRLDTYTHGAMAVKQDMYSYTSLGLTYKFGKKNPLKKMTEEYGTVTFKAEPDPLEATAGKIPVKITGIFPKDYFQPDVAMNFSPMLKCEDGTIIPLKTVTLKGEKVMGDGILIPLNGGTFTYYDTVNYQPCMRASTLMVNPIAYVPKEPITGNPSKEKIEAEYHYVELGDRKIDDGVIITPTRFVNTEVPMSIAHGYEKETMMTQQAIIYFEVNRFALNWNVPLNKLDANKQKMTELANFIGLGYQIKEINIDGWASPEGEETFNAGLSENRTKTAHTFLVDKIKTMTKEKNTKLTFKDVEKEIKFNLNHHGPDWNGFLANVKMSSIKDKNVILNVINSAGTPAKKEQEIRNMIVIYPEIEEQLLPPLRRAEIVVNCYQTKKSEEEISRLALSNPRELDEKELLYAATLTSNNDTKLSIYKSAINTYPNSYKGYVNAAAIEIEKGDLNAAKAHLEKAASLEPNNGKIYNNLGIVAAMQGDYVTAEKDFTKAQQLGEDVSYNMGIIMLQKGEYTKALNLFGNKTCDYNVALTQVALKNYPAAEKNLACAPKDARTYYLTAVVGSRTSNTALLFENLTKAVQSDPALKAEARMDREFIKYFNDPTFTSIVK